MESTETHKLIESCTEEKSSSFVMGGERMGADAGRIAVSYRKLKVFQPNAFSV